MTTRTAVNAKAEQVNRVLGDTLRAFVNLNGRKDDWPLAGDAWPLLYAIFAALYAGRRGQRGPAAAGLAPAPAAVPLRLAGCRRTVTTGGLRPYATRMKVQ